MNQINLDALLNMGNLSSATAQAGLKISPQLSYPAIVQLAKDGSSQLQLQTGQGPVQVGLDKQQTQILLSATSAPPPSVQVQLSSASGSAPNAAPSTMQPPAAAIVQPNLAATIPQHHTPAEPLLKTPSAASNAPLQLQIQLQPSADGDIQLLIKALPISQIKLTPQQVLQLVHGATQNNSEIPVLLQRSGDQVLMTLPNQKQLSFPHQWLAPAQITAALQPQAGLLKTEIKQQQISVQLHIKSPADIGRNNSNTASALTSDDLTEGSTASQPSIRSAAERTIGLSNPTQRTPKETSAPIQTNAAQRQSFANMTATLPSAQADHAVAVAVGEPQEKKAHIPPGSGALLPPMSPSREEIAPPPHKASKAPIVLHLFNTAQIQQLLPLLVKTQQPDPMLLLQDRLQLGAIALAKIPAQPSASAGPMQLQWQLKGTEPIPQLQWHIELTESEPLPVLKVDPSHFSRAVTFASTRAPAEMPAEALALKAHPLSRTAFQPDVAQIWRQLLPLNPQNFDPLIELPTLPAAVLAVLKEIKMPSLDVAKPVSPQLLQQQLSAALQFTPLQQMAKTDTAAASIAIAIQLLLGRVSSPSEPTSKNSSANRMQGLVSQLDQSQSSLLLRQLSGHAGKMQSAQLATAEQQSNQNNQLFIHLPFVQQGESRFAEVAITEREAGHEQKKIGSRQWQLTLKFDLGNLGRLLAKVNLSGAEVDLQLYAEQADVVGTAEKFLPLLKDRLKMQGVAVTEAQCQLGKIPEQLFQRSHRLLAVRV